MIKPGLWKRFVRTTMALAVGGSAFQLSGCDPEVRQQFVDVVEATVLGVTSVWFLTLQDDISSTDGLTTTAKLLSIGD